MLHKYNNNNVDRINNNNSSNNSVHLGDDNINGNNKKTIRNYYKIIYHDVFL